MPRPQKCRRICELPEHKSFGPRYNTESGESITLAIDEYETIRLIDLENLTQEECAEQMNVARTTVQAIYNAARVKIADAIVNGKNLDIVGGKYVICNRKQGCYRSNTTCIRLRGKERKKSMKVAIPVNEDRETICVSLGRTKEFAIYDETDQSVTFIKNTACDSEGGAGVETAQLLIDEGVVAVITKRCGENAANVLKAADVALYQTSSQNLFEEVEKYKKKELKPLTNISQGFHHHSFDS